MTYRIIALDLDDTLLDKQKKILPKSLTALALARQQGVKVVIATGRHHSAIHPFYQALDLDTPAICCNATYLYDYHHKQTSQANPLTAAQAKKMLTLLGEYGMHGLIYANDGILYQEPTGHVIRTQAWGETLPPHQHPTFLHVDNLLNAADRVQNIWKFALSHSDTQALNNFANRVMAEFGLTCEWSWQDQVDVAQSGNNKGKLLSEWVTSQGYSMSEVLAFGDIAHQLKNDYSRCPDMWQRSIASCYQNNVAWLYPTDSRLLPKMSTVFWPEELGSQGKNKCYRRFIRHNAVCYRII